MDVIVRCRLHPTISRIERPLRKLDGFYWICLDIFAMCVCVHVIWSPDHLKWLLLGKNTAIYPLFVFCLSKGVGIG